ncbi:hypothetical protein FSST1_012416 [Fusarium sambucinum]
MNSHNDTTQRMRSNLMDQTPDSLIPYALVTLLAVMVYWSQFTQPKDLLNPRKTFEFSNIPRLKRYMENSNSLDTLATGAARFVGKPFRLFCEWGELTILPPQMIDEIKSDKRFDFGAAASDDNHAYIPGFGALMHDPVMPKVIGRHLTKALAKLTSPLSEEAALVMQSVITDSTEWHTLNLNEHISTIVSRMSSRVFMGEELCRDEGWNNASAYYTRKTFEAMMILCVIPRWLRPYIHWVLPQCREVRRALTAARKELNPHIERRERIKTEALARGEKPPFDDAIEWFAQSGSELPPADCQIALTLAAIHTTTDLLSQTMVNMATYPEMFTALREEIIRVLSEQGLKKTALADLKLMDSFLKETQRMKPILIGWRRRALENVTLSNGTTVKKGNKIVVTANHMWSDENYNNAKTFNPYRFVPKDNEQMSYLVNTSPNHLGFGHGLHSCPGRWFASNEVKIALCHLLLKYDWKLVDGKRPEPVAFGMAYVANPEAKLLIRRRKEELNLSTLEY